MQVIIRIGRNALRQYVYMFLTRLCVGCTDYGMTCNNDYIIKVIIIKERILSEDKISFVPKSVVENDTS